MILQELYKLALREKLLDDPAFADRALTFVVRIDETGAYRGLEPMLDERGRGRTVRAPKVPVRSSGIATAFLVDNVQYTLRIAKDGKQDNADKRAAAFDALVASAADETHDAGLVALQRFLARRAEFIDALRADAPTRAAKKGAAETPWEWNGDETVAFALVGEVERVDERDAVVAWWRSRRVADSAGAGGDVARCLVTGELAPVTREAHSKIKGVPEGNTTGTSLISCNANAFKTHGQDDTDPVSAAGAEAYVRALNWLLERDGNRRFRQGVLLDKGTVVVFWTRAPNSVIDALLSLGAGLFDDEATPDAAAEEKPAKPTKRAAKAPGAASPDAMRATVTAPFKGLDHESTDETDFFALTLAGNSARAVVRDWLTASAGAIKRHVSRWFDDLRVVGASDRPIPLRSLLEALQSRPDATKDKGEAPPELATRLFRAAVTGGPLPRRVIAMAVQRFRIVDDAGRQRRMDYRAAILRCALNREHRNDPRWKEITVALDPTASDPGYVLGRLFALLEQMQLKASGKERDLNATIRDRYFGAASSTPGAVFPLLLRLSVHHASKLAKDGDNWIERQKSEVMNLLPAKTFPAVLDLDQQGLFALGYYHQRQERFRSRNEAAAQPAPAPTHSPEGDV